MSATSPRGSFNPAASVVGPPGPHPWTTQPVIGHLRSALTYAETEHPFPDMLTGPVVKKTSVLRTATPVGAGKSTATLIGVSLGMLLVSIVRIAPRMFDSLFQ